MFTQSEILLSFSSLYIYQHISIVTYIFSYIHYRRYLPFDNIFLKYLTENTELNLVCRYSLICMIVKKHKRNLLL